jgi:hypothetical protein
MKKLTPHQCRCQNCQNSQSHPDQLLHQQFNLLLSRLDEQQRRWWAAHEANRLGYGGIRLVAQITGLDEKTISRGQAELATSLRDRPVERLRVSGGGRKALEKKSRS